MKDLVEVELGVLLSLGHVAPTQHTDPCKVPPLEHSQLTQQPFVQPPFDSSSNLELGFGHTSQ